MKTTTGTLIIALCSAGLAVQADVVIEWNSAALDAIRADKTPPPKASRYLAILHASIYDAVNGISRTHESYFVLPSVAIPASASREAAASAAAHKVLLNIAMADAAICAWDAKYFFNFWRPVTAIRNGDTDGNPATEPDPAWDSFIATPPFPDYVSGHSTFSGAASTVLALFYGTDNIAFTTGSDFLPGAFRTFHSFSAAAEEAAMSRLYGGIHFRFANDDGLLSGLGIGSWTFTEYLQPEHHEHRSGSGVLQPGMDPGGVGPQCANQPGRPRPVSGQGDGRTALADGQIRGRLFARLRHRACATARIERFLLLLQSSTMASRACQSDAHAGIQELPLRRTGGGPAMTFVSLALLGSIKGEERSEVANIKSTSAGPKDGERLMGRKHVSELYENVPSDQVRSGGWRFRRPSKFGINESA